MSVVLNGNGQSHGPWWAQFLMRFGIAAGIAVFLVWFLAGHIDAEVHAIREDVREQRQEWRFYLRAICLNGAENEGERAECLQPHHTAAR